MHVSALKADKEKVKESQSRSVAPPSTSPAGAGSGASHLGSSGLGIHHHMGGLMKSIGIWKPMDRKFGLRPWLRKNITTRCGLMLSLGMRLLRKITGQN